MLHPGPYLRSALALVAALALALAPGAVQGLEDDSPFPPSNTDFGGIGLLQMPTARFGADGDMYAGASTVYPYNRYFITVQGLPWLLGTLRYSEVSNRLYFYSQAFGSNQTYKDRGLDVKLRLLKESEYVPQAAVGFQDFLGTSLFAGEYVVASKRWYHWDFTLGMGWGYLGNRGTIKNPLCVIAQRFCRSRIQGQEAGSVSAGDLFTGERVSLFGGVEYHTPIEGLRLKAEYDANDYQNEPQDNDRKVDLPINFGAVYRVFDWLDLSVGLERGNTLMLQAVANANFHRVGIPKLFDSPPTPIVPRSHEEPDYEADPAIDVGGPGSGGNGSVMQVIGIPQIPSSTALPKSPDANAVEKRITQALQAVGFQVDAVNITDVEAAAFISQDIYRQLPQAIGRAARILVNEAPHEVELITVVLLEDGLEVNRTTMLRKDLERTAIYLSSPEEIWVHTQLSAKTGKPGPNAYINPDRYPDLSWFLMPSLRQHIGGPDNFYFYQFYLRLGAELELRKGTSLTGVLGFNVADNLDQLELESDSQLPRVRSDIAQYLKEGRTGLYRLQSDHLRKLSDSWYSRLSFGLLEEMFGGVSGEILYRPYGKRWALGADINWVKQRDYDMLFSFRDYETVTGHGTFYYEFPIYDVSTAISAGRYLAKDVGATFDVARRFDSGIVVGAFATFTNVSADEFGEGSFDKGIYISVPLDAFFARSTRSRVSFAWRPLTRDGGQRLTVAKRLFPLTSRASLGAIAQDWPLLLQ